MKSPEELLQEKLELLEAGTPVEVCLTDLPESEAELLKLAATLRKVSYPARNQAIAAAQRASLLKAANQEKQMNQNSNEKIGPGFLTILRGWLQPAMNFSGAMVVLMLLAVTLGVWGMIASQSANEKFPAEVVMEENNTAEIAPESSAGTTESAVSATPTPVTVVADPSYLALLPVLSTNLVQNPQSAALKEVRGVVEVQQTDGSWTAVSAGSTLSAGQRIRTGKLSNTTIAFYDGSEATISANSELSIDELDARTDGPRTIVLTQWVGESDHEVAKVADANGRYEVLTPSGSGTAQGTAFHVLVTPSLFSYFDVSEGSVAVTSLDVTVIVIAGQITIINPGEIPSEPYFRITGEGQVTEIGPVWTIGGQTFETHENTILIGMPEVGDWVFVEGHLEADGSRVADKIILLESTPTNSFTLTGEVTDIGDTSWTVAGQTIVISETTTIDEGIEVGDQVRVTGEITTDGTLIATHIQRLEEDELHFEFTGVVEELTAESWTISGVTIAITEETEIEAGIILGDMVKAEGRILEDSTWLADEISKSDEEEPGFEFVGIVESMDPWQVSGIAFETREWTEIEAGIEPGDLVRVEGNILPDGTWVAAEIDSLEDEDGVLITFVGIVNSIDPWVVSGIPLTISETTVISGEIEVGTLVRVEATILADGTWLALEIRPLYPIIIGCFDITSTILNINGNQLELSNWSPVTLEDNVIVTGDLQPDSIILIHICIQDDTVIIITIIVIHGPVIIIINPSPSTTPQPPGDDGGQVTICHKDKNTLTLPQSAIPAHLGHGDYLGPCTGGGGNGNGNKP